MIITPKIPKKIIIFSNKYTIKAAKLLKLNLENININSELFNKFITQDIIDKYLLDLNTYFFLFCPQAQLCNPKIKINLPKNRYFLYQIEQLNQNIFPYQNVNIIENFILNSYITFDYSEVNLSFYPEKLKTKVKILKPFIDEKIISSEKSIDILFIGTLSERRNKILNYLKPILNIVIVEKVFGDELSNLISKAKIILNLHTWDNCIFELFRIHEVLPYNINIISEEGILEKSLMKRYENYIKLFPAIKDDLSNINNLLTLINTSLLEKEITNRDNLINNLNKENLSSLKVFIKNQDYPTLLNKYHLNLSDPNIEINYNIILNENVKFKKRNFAHLHCYDLSNFNEIYGKYLSNIEKLFNIIITFSLNNNNFKNDNYIFLEIENKGYDIGGKFVMIQYLLNNNIDYDYILFLQSKSNEDKRKKYFEIVDDNNINNLNILMDKNYAGIFPSIKKFENFAHESPFPNKYYVKEILDYLNLKILTSDFFEGNCMILNKEIIQIIFTDNLKFFYNLLNNKDSFDINWIRWYYKPNSNDPYIIYKKFKENNWLGNNLNNNSNIFLYNKFGKYGINEKKNLEIASNYKFALFNESLEGTNFADAMIEHAFERIFVNVILNKDEKYYIIGNNHNIDFEQERRKIYEEKRLQKLLELKNEKLENERLEKERLENEKIEKERLNSERIEKERLNSEKIEKERLDNEKLEKETLEKERLDNEKLEKERLKKERLEKERLENEDINLQMSIMIEEIFKYNENNKLLENQRKNELIEKLLKEKNKLEILKHQKIKLNDFQSKILDDIQIIEKRNKLENANKIMIKIIKRKINEFEIRKKTSILVKKWKIYQEKMREENKTIEKINNKKLEILEYNRLSILKREEHYIKELERKELEYKENLNKKKEELRCKIEFEIVEKEKFEEKEYLKNLFIEKMIKNQSLRDTNKYSEFTILENIDNSILYEKNESNINMAKEFINYLNTNIEIKDFNYKISNFINNHAAKIIQKFIKLFLRKINENIISFSQPKIVLIYHYQSKKNQQKNLTNLSFFIKYGLNKNYWRDIDLTILLIINGDICDIILPERSDLIIWKNLKNMDDLTSYKEGIKFLENKFNNKLYNLFNYLFFLNDKAFGPIKNKNKEEHWIDPFIKNLNDNNSIVCFPNKEYEINYLPIFSQFCSLIKIDRKIYNLFLSNNLSKIFLKENKISSYILRDKTEDFFNKQIFIINNWIINENSRNSYPIKFKECKEFYYDKLNLEEIRYSNLPFNYKNLQISENIYLKNNDEIRLVTNSKLQAYNLFGKSEEYIVWNILPTNNQSIVIYNHLINENYIDDYILISLHCLINLKYDIIFNTISERIDNIDLPFAINYFEDKENINNYMNFQTLKNISSNYEWILLVNSDILLPIHNFENMKLTIEKYRKDNDYYGLYGNKGNLYDGFIEYKNKCIPTLLNLYKTNSYMENINRFKNSCVISTDNIKNLDYKIFLENKNCFGIYWRYINFENINYSNLNYLSRFICKDSC
jgi:hypothetical protein